ncbi:hypothetical protein D3C78_910790 [compost metagenome]
MRVEAAQRQTVERRHRPQFGVALEHEVAEEAQVLAALRGLAEQFAQCRQVLLVADHAEDVAGLQVGAAAGVEQFAAAEQRGDARAFGHLQHPQRRTDAPAVGTQLVDEHLPLAGRVDLQAGTGDRRRLRRHLDPCLVRRPAEGAALQQQRHQHDEERHVEEQLGVGQAGDQREHREDHRHRAAQADPGDEQALAEVEGAKRQQADEHRQRPGEQDHPQRQQQRRHGDRQQLAGGEQQAEDQEHADLAEPGQAVEHVQDAVAVADRPVAEHQAADVHGEDAAAADFPGEGVDHDAAADRQQRVEAVGHRQAVDQLQQQPAAGQAEDDADAELQDQRQQHAPAEAGLPGGEHADQGHGEEHRHRVVAARLDLQGRADPLVEALAVEQVEHHGGVGGGDDGADQQAFEQLEVEQPGGGQAGQPGGDHHADGGQRHRRPQGDAEGGHPGAHAAVEEDHRQRQVADQVGQRVVVEDDAADAVDAGEHAHGEEDHQYRDADARRERADQDADADQQCADEEQAVDGGGIHGGLRRRLDGRVKSCTWRANRF